MNHLNNWLHRWHCASGYRKDYLLLCNNSFMPQHLNWLYLQILNTVPNRDEEEGSLTIGRGLAYMPHKHLWGKFKVRFFFDHCPEGHVWSASSNLQQLKLWILFTGHSSMAYDNWEWRIDHWLRKSTQHSLPSLRWPFNSVCQHENQASLGPY